MLRTSINSVLYSLFLNRALSEFVSNNIAHIIDGELAIMEDLDSVVEISNELFPKRFIINNSKEACCYVLEGIRDRLRSDTYYSSFTPLQNYVMYHAIKGYCEVAYDLGYSEEWLCLKMSDELRKWVCEEERDKEAAMAIIDECEHIDLYNGMLYEDLDFLDENIRALVEYAISDVSAFEKIGMTLEELDRFIEVMPIDVAEEYKAFREKVSDRNMDGVDLTKEISRHTTINVYGNISNSQIQVGSVNSNSIVNNNESFPYEEVLKIVTEIRKYEEKLIQDLGEKGERFTEVLDEITKEVDAQGNPSKIKKTLGVLKEFVVGVSGSLVASEVLALLQNIKF